MPNQPQTPPAGSNTTQAKDGTQLNALAVNLAKAIRQHESGSDYNAVGDLNKGVSKGAYQFNGNNFKTWATQYGLDPNDFSPTNQDKVAYAKINEDLQNGLAPSEVVARWNGSTFKNGKYVANNPAYVDAVKQQYATIVGGGAQNTAAVASAQPQQQSNGFVTPPTYTPDNSGVNTAYAAGGAQEPKTAGQEALGLGGKALDFFFPIVGDVSNLAQGKNTKTGLQLLGDTAMSVLPFIPGLGEAGLAAKGLKAASLAGKVAKGAEEAGLASKLISNPLVRNAGVGYGMGTAQNLSQGQSLQDAIAPNFNNLVGGGLGLAAPFAGKAISSVVKKAAGINPMMENALRGVGNVQQYDRYATAAKERATNVRAPSVQNLAADDMEGAAKILKTKIQTAGEQVGQAKKDYGAKKLIINAPADANGNVSSLTGVMQNFAQNVENKFGVKVSVGPTGKVYLDRIPGRMKDVLSTTDEGRIKTALSQLMKLRKGGNVQQASDVIDNLDSLVDYSKKDLLGNSNDPLEGFFKTTRHDLNDVVGKSSPELAQAKGRFSELKDAEKLMGGMAGKNLQRGELLMRRVFTGDMGQDVVKLFDRIKQETGVDLVDSAVLAKHMTETMGSKADKTALQQMIEGAAESHTGGLLNGVSNLAGGLLRRTIANPEKIGRRIVQGKSAISPLMSGAIPRAGLIGTKMLGSIGGI